MVQRESLQPDDWHRRGEADLSAAEILLANEGDTQVAAALVQQGVEKHLKGWLHLSPSVAAPSLNPPPGDI